MGWRRRRREEGWREEEGWIYDLLRHVEHKKIGPLDPAGSFTLSMFANLATMEVFIMTVTVAGRSQSEAPLKK